MDRLDRAIGNSITAAVRANMAPVGPPEESCARCPRGLGRGCAASPAGQSRRRPDRRRGRARRDRGRDPGARSHVHLTGWFMSPDSCCATPGVRWCCGISWPRRQGASTCASSCGRVRRFPSSGHRAEPSGRVRDELRRAGPIACARTRANGRFTAITRAIVIDDRVAFVGGIDLTSFGGDRRDASDHPARAQLGWHDAAARIEGPVVGDVADHFRMRWRRSPGSGCTALHRRRQEGSPSNSSVRCPSSLSRAAGTVRLGCWSRIFARLRSARRLNLSGVAVPWSPEIVAVAGRQAARPARGPVQDGARASRQAEGRRRRHTRRAGRARRRRRRRRPACSGAACMLAPGWLPTRSMSTPSSRLSTTRWLTSVPPT